MDYAVRDYAWNDFGDFYDCYIEFENDTIIIKRNSSGSVKIIGIFNSKNVFVTEKAQ